MHADSLLPPPNTIYASLVESRQIIFTWSPVTPECTTIQYNILASNCGRCPTATNHTTVTCTDVPTTDEIDNATACTFAVQAINCEIIMGKLSDPITVLLKETSLMTTSNSVLSTHNPSDNTNQNHGYVTSLSLACIFAVGLMMSIVALVTVIAITYRKRVVKENIAALELVIPTAHATHSEIPDSADGYENVLQSSQEHIKTSRNVAYDHVVAT